MRIKPFVFFSFIYQNAVALPDEGLKNTTTEDLAVNSSIGSDFVNTGTTLYYEDADLKQNAENDNLNKTDTNSFAEISTTEAEHAIQTDAALVVTIETEITYINVTGLINTTTEGLTVNSSIESDFDNKGTKFFYKEAKPENDNLNKTETNYIAVKKELTKTDGEHTTLTDAASIVTVENETTDINVTGLINTTTEGLTVNTSSESDFDNKGTTFYYVEAKPDVDLKQIAENDNLNKTEMNFVAVKKEISTFDEEHTNQTETTLIVTVENETTDINVTVIKDTITEETTSVKEKKWLNKQTFLLLVSTCTVCGALVVLASVIVARKRSPSNEEDDNVKMDRYSLIARNEQTEGNTYCVAVSAEMKMEMQTFSYPKSSAEDTCSTSAFINTSNENEHSELKKQTFQNEYYDNMN